MHAQRAREEYRELAKRLPAVVAKAKEYIAAGDVMQVQWASSIRKQVCGFSAVAVSRHYAR